MSNNERVVGRLVVTNLSMRLPCSRTCPFNRQCAEKYQDDVCAGRIDDFVRQQVYGTPGEKIINDGKIRFETSTPDGKVAIYNGSVNIIR
ncbi:hypothetical protein A2714_02120 [Candidatus Woesebacteria bacterium RIFCSPHIGHO2_01_FULL_38_9]|uniref:Uncharacterized protein n=1 Tax=Candidatus Woesebacteria bacterium RIFCSPHIGHO2_01_FULL_38_9 TaxID=1802492 RepID=A0A1F7Y2V9_9BACT|nr:MAG: hypothetical protein A2714_02120 [Candidatus Woesebacteria bacterium RIFCSPHIGHO2_01_FULL_38_9]